MSKSTKFWLSQKPKAPDFTVDVEAAIRKRDYYAFDADKDVDPGMPNSGHRAHGIRDRRILLAEIDRLRRELAKAKPRS